MLTRLKVSGFKNLLDVDVEFGPFTCIAGANGVGKSNLFDAIRFLSALADKPLLEAALSVRDEGGRAADIRNLFHRVGEHYTPQMSFEAEMVIPSDGVDDLNQRAEASITFLKYTLILAWRNDELRLTSGNLELVKEELVHINIGDATKKLKFPHKPTWRKSVVKGRRTSPYISTDEDSGQRIIRLHQDGSSGRPRPLLATDLPRTVLSVANATESPTVLLARREMQSWQLLQLEPTALRQPDEFTAPTTLGMNGSHLPATLFRLAHILPLESNILDTPDSRQVYSQVANRLSELIDDVYTVWVDQDEKRELLTLLVEDRARTPHPARSLSDGTLRFLALAILELDPKATGLLCLEEPENGIHPERIPAMLRLLQDIAVDADESVDRNNTLRQVIVNTHSPALVYQVPEDSLLVAELKETITEGEYTKHVQFSGLSSTWRDDGHAATVSKGKLLSYLNPVRFQQHHNGNGDTRRVVDRDDIQLMLPWGNPRE